MRCRTCRKKLPRDVSFCLFCGSPRARGPAGRRLVGATIALCVLTFPAMMLYPYILRLIAPGAYVSLGAARASDALTEAVSAVKDTWGVPDWERALADKTCATLSIAPVRVTDEGMGETALLPEEQLQQMKWNGRVWIDKEAGTVASSSVLTLAPKAFALQTWADRSGLTVAAPALFRQPLRFPAGSVGESWDASFLRRLFPWPEGLTLNTNKLPHIRPSAEPSQLAVLAKRFAPLMRRAQYEAVQPQQDETVRVEAALNDPEMLTWMCDMVNALSDVGYPFVPVGQEEWKTMRDILLGAVFEEGRMTCVIDREHRLCDVGLQINCVVDRQAYMFEVRTRLSDRQSPLNGLALEWKLRKGSTVVCRLLHTLDGVRLPVQGAMKLMATGESFSGQKRTGVVVCDVTMGLDSAQDNVEMNVTWNDTFHAKLLGSYSVDHERNRVQLKAMQLTFGDEQDTFRIEGLFSLDIAAADRADAAWPAPLAGARPVEALNRFEQEALLESYYAFFTDTPLFDPAFAY